MRLRFTIRDLLWLTAVAAVCMAWWLDHRRLTANRCENNLTVLQIAGFTAKAHSSAPLPEFAGFSRQSAIIAGS